MNYCSNTFTAFKNPKGYARALVAQKHAEEQRNLWAQIAREGTLHKQSTQIATSHIDLQRKTSDTLQEQLKLLRQVHETAVAILDPQDPLDARELTALKQETKRGLQAIAGKTLAMAHLPLPALLFPPRMMTDHTHDTALPEAG
jgi:hypothetical protein